MNQKQLDRFLDWIHDFRDTFDLEKMKIGPGAYLMRKEDTDEKTFMEIRFFEKL